MTPTPPVKGKDINGKTTLTFDLDPTAFSQVMKDVQNLMGATGASATTNQIIPGCISGVLTGQYGVRIGWVYNMDRDLVLTILEHPPLMDGKVASKITDWFMQEEEHIGDEPTDLQAEDKYKA